MIYVHVLLTIYPYRSMGAICGKPKSLIASHPARINISDIINHDDLSNTKYNRDWGLARHVQLYSKYDDRLVS